MTLVREAAGGGGGGNTIHDIVHTGSLGKTQNSTRNTKESVHWSMISALIYTPTLYEYLSYPLLPIPGPAGHWAADCEEVNQPGFILSRAGHVRVTRG